MDLVLGLVWYINLLLALTLHEAAHAYAAFLGGDWTAYHGGQVTLDPRPHIRREPLGTVFFPWITYLLGGWMMGWASAPYDPYWARNYPRRAAWMAMAGPVANLGLAIVSWTILKVGLEVQWFSPPPPDKAGFEALVAGTSPLGDSIAPILSIMCSLNLILFLFNLIPVPPLDGSGVITLAMSPDQARRFQEFVSQPMVNIIGLVIAWRVSDLIIAPVYGVMVRALWTSW